MAAAHRRVLSVSGACLMAALLLGVAGAAAGGVIGGTFLGMSAASIGWMAGLAAHSLLFPTSTDLPPAFGPRLGDLKIQTSTYGSAIPRAYGTVRLAGNVIWAPPIVETATTTTTTSGGRGGGGGATQTQTTYSYSADFAIAICEGPIIGISRIWANGKLIHNLSATASIGSVLASDRDFTVYLGSETQTADPTMEAAEGAGNVPGYRGTAYVVFNDMALGEFGNRIPNIEFEVVASGTIVDSGTLWTSRSAPADIWLGVVYGNGLFVAVGGNGSNSVMTSTDGVTWTQGTIATTNELDDVAYSNGMFAAVIGSGEGLGSLNRVWISRDGFNWSLRQ